jgi:sugar phosphate isomerase/epimerase
MWLAYNTNGLAHHRLFDAFALLADLGYDGVALTPDVAHLDPATTSERDWEAARHELERRRLRCVVETGARYLLEPRRKHWPSLVTRDEAAARRRIDAYERMLRMAQLLGAELVSIWSGALEPDVAAAQAWPWLVERLKRVLDRAATAKVPLAFEPEPGMLVASLADYRELRRRLRDAGRDDLVTTIDVGHLLVTEPGPAHAHLAELAPTLRNVQLDDAKRGVHEHLPLGEGDLELAPLLQELRRLDYRGPLALELSRDSHRAAALAEATARTLLPLLRADDRSRA